MISDTNLSKSLDTTNIYNLEQILKNKIYKLIYFILKEILDKTI